MARCTVCKTAFDLENEGYCPVCGPPDRVRSRGYAPMREDHKLPGAGPSAAAGLDGGVRSHMRTSLLPVFTLFSPVPLLNWPISTRAAATTGRQLPESYRFWDARAIDPLAA